VITALLVPLTLLAQQRIADRLGTRVPTDLAAIVEAVGDSAAARGLPVDPLIQKAIEGSAKGIATERVATAVRLVATQLDTAAAALRGSGIADTTAIASGGFAINAGLSGRDIAQLARSGAAGSALIVGLRVAGTLAALGVPPRETVDLVLATLQAGRPAADLLALPGRVQAAMAQGLPPAEAAAGLARAAAAQSRPHGPPPGRGQPNHPPAPAHP
jgi:hypothetical protein